MIIFTDLSPRDAYALILNGFLRDKLGYATRIHWRNSIATTAVDAGYTYSDHGIAKLTTQVLEHFVATGAMKYDEDDKCYYINGGPQ